VRAGEGLGLSTVEKGSQWLQQHHKKPGKASTEPYIKELGLVETGVVWKLKFLKGYLWRKIH
jgi:hypothetical protein